MTADEARAYLSGLSFHRERKGDVAYMHPDFAIRLATAIQQARAQGLQVSLLSGYREPSSIRASNYDLAGKSSHEYGLAADVTGIGGVGSSSARQWQQIAEANGLSNPYGINDKGEYNHWQLPKQPLETTQGLWDALRAGKASGDVNKMWSAYTPNAANMGSGGPIASPNDNRALFFNAFVKAGMSPQQALGALWSMGGESYPNIKTDAYNPNDPGGAFGAAQWTQERRLGLDKYAASLGKPATDPQTQVDYLIQGELLGKLPQYAITQKGVWDALLQAKTPEDASRVWTTMMERPANAEAVAEERIKRGAAVGSIDANGNFVPGVGGSGPAGAPVASGTVTPGAKAPGEPPAPPPNPWASLGSALSTAFNQMSNVATASSVGGTYLDASQDQPAIRTPALGADFTPPPPNPVPAALAGGIGTTLGSLAIQPQTDPLVDPSITQGAPSMTSMLGTIGTNAPPSLFDPRGTSNPRDQSLSSPDEHHLMASSVGGDLAAMTTSHAGSTNSPVNTGGRNAPGSGNKSGGGGGGGGVQRAPQTPGQTPMTAPPVGRAAKKPPPPPHQMSPRPYSAQNPPLGTAPPPIPHPGLIPPYPDARSPQPTLMPNGVPIMPPPVGFMGEGMIPRVPKTFIPGMTGLLGR